MVKIRIFYDGLDIEKYAKDSRVEGFTTNCSIFGKSPFKSYKAFYEANRDAIGSKPMSLQIWKETPEEVIEQIDAIHAIDSRIYVKVPIVNTRGEYNEAPIRHAVKNRIPLNVTAIHTLEQIKKAGEFLEGSSAPEIISVFGGPISDLYIDPTPFIVGAVEQFKGKANSEILWAGCRELYTIKRAADMGCHIITIPDTMMDRLYLLDKTLETLTIDRVTTFHKDAMKGGFTIGKEL